MYHHKWVKPQLTKILLRHCDRSKKLLDIGCGDGVLAHNFAQLGFKVVGIDRSEENIGKGQKKYPNLKLIHCDIFNFTVEKKSELFDIVIATEVIEHICNSVAFVNKIKSILKPKGLLLMTTPYHGYVKDLLIALMAKNSRHYYPFGEHVRFFSVKTLSVLIQRAGFNNIKFYGVGRLPFIWKSMIVTCTAP